MEIFFQKKKEDALMKVNQLKWGGTCSNMHIIGNYMNEEKNYGDIWVASVISWSEMIFFYQCIFSEIMTSPEPISSYCQWHSAPVSTLWNHQIRSSELICDLPGKGQQHLSSLSSSLTAALPGLHSLLSRALLTQWMILKGHVCIRCVMFSFLEHVVMRAAHKWHSKTDWFGFYIWNVLLEHKILELEVRKFRL